MTEPPREKTPESGKPNLGESGVPVGTLRPVAGKGAEFDIPRVARSRRNLLPAEECSTISDSDIPSERISELFSDTSWPEKWTDSNKEQPCDGEEDEILSVKASSVKIELSDVVPHLCLAKSFEVERWANQAQIPKTTKSKPFLSVRLPCKSDTLAGNRVQCAVDPQILPGCGDPKALPRLSKVQRIVIKKVDEEYGYLYPYVPACLEKEIQEKRMQWIDAAIRSYLSVPLCGELEKMSPRHTEKYANILQTWNYGRHIYFDCVIIRRPNQKDIQHYITTIGSSGKPLQLPDPSYYW